MSFSTLKTLEFACAAYRLNQGYYKESQNCYNDDGTVIKIIFDNKTLVKNALLIYKFNDDVPLNLRPTNLVVSDEDVTLASKIVSYFKRLTFRVLKTENAFETTVNNLLNSEKIGINQIGYITCLPHVYYKELEETRINRYINSCEDFSLGNPGDTIFDKDCEIIKVKKSNNFNAWNVLAVIDSKLVSWMTSKDNTVLGAAVLVKAKIKYLGVNFKTGKCETRLYYVKIEQ